MWAATQVMFFCSGNVHKMDLKLQQAKCSGTHCPYGTFSQAVGKNTD